MQRRKLLDLLSFWSLWLSCWFWISNDMWLVVQSGMCIPTKTEKEHRDLQLLQPKVVPETIRRRRKFYTRVWKRKNVENCTYIYKSIAAKIWESFHWEMSWNALKHTPVIFREHRPLWPKKAHAQANARRYLIFGVGVELSSEKQWTAKGIIFVTRVVLSNIKTKWNSLYWA